MPLSFWEKESFQSWDFVVVGGGIVGLSTAISLKEKSPGASVLLLERGLLPTGASTRNAGFACFGSLTELVEDMKVLGEAGCLALVKRRWEGLKKLRERTGDKAICFSQCGGYELISENEETYLPEIGRVNNLLRGYFGEDVFKEEQSLIGRFGFNKTAVKTVVANPFEGQLHTGEMIKSLWAAAVAKNVHVLTGCEVKHIGEANVGAEVVAYSAAAGEEIVFLAGEVAVATNAFTVALLPGLDITPGRGQVFVTRPLKQVPFRGVFHMDCGYYYFRDVGDRILLGGGRNLDFEGETTTSFGTNTKILTELQRLLRETIAPGLETEIDHQWSGIMAFGKTKEPVLKRISPHIAVGARLGGMGVAIGSLVGEELADLLLHRA